MQSCSAAGPNEANVFRISSRDLYFETVHAYHPSCGSYAGAWWRRTWATVKGMSLRTMLEQCSIKGLVLWLQWGEAPPEHPWVMERGWHYVVYFKAWNGLGRCEEEEGCCALPG